MLDANEVKDLFFDCFYDDKESTHDDMIKVEGIFAYFGFNPVKLEKHIDRIHEMLDELSPEFVIGHSFLKLCEDRHGNQWGEHQNCEQLMCLGMAVNRVHYLAPRELWDKLPGGMPYIAIKPKIN